MARRATLIEQERAESERILVLDAGNSLIGDREPAVSSRGRTSIEALNAMGYDAMTLGALDVTMLSLPDLETALGEAEFPVVSANAVVSATGALLTEPYAILERGGQRIAILGLTDPWEGPEVRVEDPLEAARRYLPELAERADIVVLLSRAGADVDRTIVEEFPAIDIVVGGGSAAVTTTLSSGSTVFLARDYASPGDAGTRVGVAHLTFSRQGTLADHTWLQVLLDASLPEDAEIAAWVTQALDEYRPRTP